MCRGICRLATRYRHQHSRKGVAAVKRHTAMPRPDLPAFMAKLATQSGLSALASRFVILTAARISEALGATWGEVDLLQPRCPRCLGRHSAVW